MNHLTLDERERHAYISGDTATADLCALAVDTEGLEERLEEELDAAREEAHSAEYAEGLESDAADTIERLESDLENYRRLYTLARDSFVNVRRWLTSDSLKTVTGRKEAAKRMGLILTELPHD